MKRTIALVLLLSSCEPFPDEDHRYEGAREGFEIWKEAMITGRLTECVAMTTCVPPSRVSLAI